MLDVPGPLTVAATAADGAIVTYGVSATDDTDPAPIVNCTPMSGTTFAIGDTTVACTATDASGNAATGTFRVHVKGAGEQLADLAAAVARVGPGTSLRDKLNDAQAALARNHVPGTCSILSAFVNEAKAQSGKKIPTPQATALIADANRIKTVLGCTSYRRRG